MFKPIIQYIEDEDYFYITVETKNTLKLAKNREFDENFIAYLMDVWETSFLNDGKIVSEDFYKKFKTRLKEPN